MNSSARSNDSSYSNDPNVPNDPTELERSDQSAPAVRPGRILGNRPPFSCPQGLRAARGSTPDGRGGGVGCRNRRDVARRSGNRHGKDACVSDSGDPQRPTGARLHGDQEPPGTDLLQGSARASAGARCAIHSDPDEGSRQLSLSAPLGGLSRRCRGDDGERTPAHRVKRSHVAADRR